jgi:hypothetical protein
MSEYLDCKGMHYKKEPWNLEELRSVQGVAEDVGIPACLDGRSGNTQRDHHLTRVMLSQCNASAPVAFDPSLRQYAGALAMATPGLTHTSELCKDHTAHVLYNQPASVPWVVRQAVCWGPRQGNPRHDTHA